MILSCHSKYLHHVPIYVLGIAVTRDVMQAACKSSAFDSFGGH